MRDPIMALVVESLFLPFLQPRQPLTRFGPCDPCSILHFMCFAGGTVRALLLLFAFDPILN